MTPNTTGPRTRRRAMAAASGLAALALVLSACSNDESAEDAVADATSAVASAATEATSAVGSAAAEATSAVASAADDADRDDRDDQHEGDHEDKDRAFLDEVRAGGVDVRDDDDFLIRGHDACRDLEDGESADVVIGKYYDAHPEAGENEGETVVTAAVNAFCPDYAPALNN